MIVLDVVYPQFWDRNIIEAKTNFYFHMNVMKATFRVLCKVGESGKIVLALLLNHILNLQSSHFKMTMIHNFKVVMCKESSLNPTTRLWHKIITSPILHHKLLEYMKLIEIVVVQVLGFVEDEHTFHIVSFMKLIVKPIEHTFGSIYLMFQSTIFYIVKLSFRPSHCQVAR